jgi:hypothetical protein
VTEAGSVSEALIVRCLKADERRDEAAMRDLAAAHFAMTWPRSDERYRSQEDALGASSAQADVPTPAGVRALS